MFNRGRSDTLRVDQLVQRAQEEESSIDYEYSPRVQMPANMSKRTNVPILFRPDPKPRKLSDISSIEVQRVNPSKNSSMNKSSMNKSGL